MPSKLAVLGSPLRKRLLAILCFALIAGPAGAEPVVSVDDFALEDFAGEVIYLDFWASWCEPCKASFRWMSALQDAHANGGLRVIAVNVDRDQAAAEAFMQAHDSRFLIVMDPAGTMAERYAIMGMPSSYLLDQTGEVLLSHRGFLARDIPLLESQIDAALAARP